MIAEGRKFLKISTDYTKSIFQNKKDAGPIQEGNYTLFLKADMSYDKSKAAVDGVGLNNGKDFKALKNFLVKVQAQGQESVLIKVKYQ